MNDHEQDSEDFPWLNWEKCAEDGCEGVLLPGKSVCLTHASQQERSRYLAQIRQTHGGIDLRGTEISAPLMEEVLASRAPDGRYYSWAFADFSYASITIDKAEFEWTLFRGPARFNGSTFSGWVDLSSSRFERDASFEPDVRGLLRVSNCSFVQGVSLCWGSAGELQAEHMSSEGLVLLDGFKIRGDATFRRSEFKDRVVIASTKVEGSAEFAGVTWLAPTDEKYSLEVQDWLILDGAEFVKPAHWNVRASVVSMVGTSFRDSASFAIDGSVIIVDRANFEKPARFAGETFKNPFRSGSLIRKEVLARANSEQTVIPGIPSPDPDPTMEMLLAPEDKARSAEPLPLEAQPELVSARRVSLSSVGLTDIDVSRCLFFDASGLDHLRLTNTSWAVSPRGRAKRRVLAEEVHLRERRKRSWGWGKVKADSPEWLGDPRLRPIGTAELELAEDPDPGDIAERYRQLRKGREDAKDTPGAADLYYGEMEMRRNAASVFSGEKVLLSAYWAISGYGLRASRSLIALLLVILVAMYGMASRGYCDPGDPYGDTSRVTCSAPTEAHAPSRAEVFSLSNLTVVAGTATTVVGPQNAKLTPDGHGIKLLLRVVGPLLIALSLIAVRNRVKR